MPVIDFKQAKDDITQKKRDMETYTAYREAQQVKRKQLEKEYAIADAIIYALESSALEKASLKVPSLLRQLPEGTLNVEALRIGWLDNKNKCVQYGDMACTHATRIVQENLDFLVNELRKDIAGIRALYDIADKAPFPGRCYTLINSILLPMKSLLVFFRRLQAKKFSEGFGIASALRDAAESLRDRLRFQKQLTLRKNL